MCERCLTESAAGRWVPGRGGHLPREPPQASPVPRLSLPDSSKPICLPYFDEELVPGTSLWVTGWGYTEEHGEWDSVGASAVPACDAGLAPGANAESPPAPLAGGDGPVGSLLARGCWGAPLSGHVWRRQAVGDPAAGGGETHRQRELQPGRLPRGGDREDAVRRPAPRQGGHLPGGGCLVQKEGVGWSAPLNEIAPFREEPSSWETAACRETGTRRAGGRGAPQPRLRRFVLRRGTAAGPCCTRAGTGRWWASSAGARAAGPPARPASTPASVPTSTGSTPSGGSVPYCRHRCSNTHSCSITQVSGGGGEGSGPPRRLCTEGNRTGGAQRHGRAGCGDGAAGLQAASPLSWLLKDVTLFSSWFWLPFKACNFFSLSLSLSPVGAVRPAGMGPSSPPKPPSLSLCAWLYSAPAAAGKWISSHGRRAVPPQPSLVGWDLVCQRPAKEAKSSSERRPPIP